MKTTDPSPPFRPAWWLPGPHLQTAGRQLAGSKRLVEYRRESLTTPDGDELLIDHVDGTPGSPRLLLLHGLEGSSYSVYIQHLAVLGRQRGWSVSVVNFRGCARDPRGLERSLPNRCPRLYHAGETGDPDFVIKTLADREPETQRIAAGASVGGNILLKWLGENPDQTLVQAAATLSVPYDLDAGARHLETPIRRLYLRRFLPSMREKFLSLADRFSEVRARVDVEAALRAESFHAFDDAATAPLHGFTGVRDYYEQASSIRYAARIQTPTLCLSARDDPFLPPSALEDFAGRTSPAIQLFITPRGGHVGWVEGPRPGRIRFWAETRAVDWLAARLAEVAPNRSDPAKPNPDALAGSRP